MNTVKQKGISVFVLSMLIVGAIDSIRNLPATALFGTALIFFALMAVIFFLLPVALISAQFSSSKFKEGGVYFWVKKALGEKFGFLAIWLQWINTMVWYPTILSFIAGTLAYLINPSLVQHKSYLVIVILAVFWLQTLLNLKGLHTSAKFASVCTFIGMILPMALIILAGVIWFFSGQPLQVHYSWHTLIPNLSHGESWISLTAIMTAFLGMELATVHVKHVDNAQKKFPRSLMISVAIIAITMVLGALTIAMVLPNNKINLVAGVMQAFADFLTVYHVHFLLPVLLIMILIGSVGGMINWIISPAKGLLQAAEDGYLPNVLSKMNKNNVPANMLLLQGVLVSVICLAFLLMPSVNGGYWLLTDLSTELYLFMYVLFFIAAMFLRAQHAFDEATFKIPGKKYGLYIVAIMGMLGSLLTAVIGFFPPSSIKVGSALHYEVVFSLGVIAMLLPALLFYYYKAKVHGAAVKANAFSSSN